MPTSVVEITSNPMGGGSTLAEVKPRKMKTGWVQIDLGSLVNGDQSKRDTFLVTMTHELFHVCQERYRYFWADSVRFDEMSAVHMERRAIQYYQLKGLIDWDSNMDVNPVDFWSTLKLGLDHYWVDETKKDSEKAEVMQHEGYNLALFVEFLEEKTHRSMWADNLLRRRSSITEGGISKPLMAAFNITREEFDTYYSLFIRHNKQKFADQYNNKERDYKPNKEIKITKGGKYHVIVEPDGGYSSEIRGFMQGSREPMILLMVPDAGLQEQQPDLQLVPIDKYQTFNKGAYIYKPTNMELEDNKNNRNILEIHRYISTEDLSRDTGYTIYALDKTKSVILSEDGDNLLVKLPENSYAADDRVIAGYILTIETEDGLILSKDIGEEFFENEYTIPKKSLYDEIGEEKQIMLTAKLCEYVLSGEDKLLGEESDAVQYVLGSEQNTGLHAFTGIWLPVDEKNNYSNSSDVFSLIYMEEINSFGYFEGPLSDLNKPTRWYRIKYFDYNEKGKRLTADFNKNQIPSYTRV